MSPFELEQARQTWQAFLRSGFPCVDGNWAAWADQQLTAFEGAPPYWVCRLSLATTRTAALEAATAEIDTNLVGQGDFGDAHVLLIGFIFARYLSEELDFPSTWKLLNQSADIADFIDGSAWKHVAVANDAPLPRGNAPEDLVIACLKPVAAYASLKAASLLGITL